MKKRGVAALSLALFLILGLIPTAWAVQREDLMVNEQNEKYGVVDKGGKVILPAIYDYVSIEENGTIRVSLYTGEWGTEGLYSWEGEEILPTVYSHISTQEDGNLEVGMEVTQENGETQIKCGLLDPRGNVLLPIVYDRIGDLSEGRRPVYLNGKAGYLDENFQLVIPYQYDYASRFKHGLAEVEQGGLYGVIDRDGKEVLPCIYNAIVIYKDGIIEAGRYSDQGARYGLFDREGREILPMEYDSINGSGDDDYFLLRKWGETSVAEGLADREGNIILPMVYQVIDQTSDGCWRVTQNDKCGVLDREFQPLIPLNYDSIFEAEGHEDYYTVCRNDRWGLLDREGKVVLPLEYDELDWVEEDVCLAAKGGKTGLLRCPGGEVLAPFVYDEVSRWNRNYLVVTQNGLMGALDRKTGAVLVPVEFVGVSEWGEGYTGPDNVIITRKGNLFGAYDETGKELFPCQFGTLERLSAALRSGSTDTTGVGDTSRAAGLQVDWYPEADRITRIYGSDRMALVKNGRYALFGLDGTQYTGYVFDAIGEQRAPGEFMAAQNGKWGIIDSSGTPLTDFFWETQQEAREEVGAKFVSRWADGSPPYALFDKSGTRLTNYKFWSYEPFSLGVSWVSNGTAYGLVDAAGRELTPFQYDIVEPFQEDGFSIVYQYEGRKYNAVDTTGRELWSQAEPYAKIWRAGHGLWGRGYPMGTVTFWNAQGELAFPDQYWYHTSPKGGMYGNCFDKNGVAQVYLENGESIYIDTQGNRVEGPDDWSKEPESNLHEGLVWARRDQRQLSGDWEMEKGWGFQNAEGELTVPYLYDAVGYFDQGYASVRLDGVYGLLKNPLRSDACSDWAAEELARAAERGLVTEDCARYRTYSITRAQFAHLAVNYLEKALGEPITPAPADTFTDTTDEGILKAYAAGIVQGVGEGKFSPGGLLTREQLATMLWRAMEKAGAGMYIGGMNEYTDWDQVSDWAQNALNNLVCHEVMQGTSATTLSPKDSCTVEQAILLVLRAYEKDYPTPAERQAWHEAALDRVSVQGLAIGTPLDQLPEELRSALSPVGQPYDGWATEPGKEIAQHYEAPGITIITSRATEEVLRRMVEINDEDYLMEKLGTTDRAAILERELGREYVEKIILTSDAYALVSGLKVGDSEEQARALGHVSLNGENVGGYGSTEITWEDGVVTQIEVWDYIGRRVGPFFDP